MGGAGGAGATAGAGGGVGATFKDAPQVGQKLIASVTLELHFGQFGMFLTMYHFPFIFEQDTI
jgi:hypothetical protein